MTSAGRRVDAGLSLLDRQIVDKDGRLSGNVDDLEFLEPEDGSPPYIVNILAGPGALGGRLRGRLGRFFEAVQQRLHPSENPGPASVSFGVVKRISSHIEVTVAKDQLQLNLFEKWVSENIISRIPGAEHETE